MPAQWSTNDEKQYKEIVKSQRQRGSSKDRAEEVAARTVNKRRRQEGRTANKSSSGTGNPNRPLDDRTKRELYNRAKELDIANRSSMTKQELVSAIRKAQ